MIKKTLNAIGFQPDKEHEFDIYFTNNKEELNNELTTIYVEDLNEIDKIYNALLYSYQYGGFITIDLYDLNKELNNTGSWSYKYIKTNNKEDYIKELNTIKSNNIIFIFIANGYTTLFDAKEASNIIINNNKESKLFNAYPIISEDKEHNFESLILYK
ncbi:MAG: hypothetical protein IKQ29_02965 [Bacilli bacterium]|nr:hypothetical protein [Bacilli bacterium]